MSKGSTETQTIYLPRMKSLGLAKGQSRSAQSSPRPAAPPASRHITSLPRSASHTYLPDVGGLGISVPAQAFTPLRTWEVGPKTSPHHIADLPPLDTSVDSPSQELFPELRLRSDEARKLVAGVENGSPVVGGGPATPDDGRSSVASSIRNFRNSTDSYATVSTLPTTPGPRVSITSDFSRSQSFKSAFGSAASTPSHSRSPSPPQQKAFAKREEPEANGTANGDTEPSSRRRSFHRRKSSSKKRAGEATADSERSQSSDDQAERKSRRRSGLLRRKSARASTGLIQSSISENEAHGSSKSRPPAVPPLPVSFSSDKLPSLRSQALSSNRSIPVPRLVPTDRSPGSTLSSPKKKDELWTVFRNLDADFAKFSSKSIAFKASVVRSSLIPVLRGYATHPSSRNLRPEDLDRRANILNKWWTGLIELLHGRNNQSISGTDRPAILDGISGIMDRPEWRLSPSPFCPLQQQRGKETLSSLANRSKTSLASSTSDFLADSVHHNVRNIFVQNLTAQMAFVVDKMSLRNASASLVTFCGKACAYAFMFVPGMADVLVRLWDLRIDSLRRVLHGNGIDRFENVSSWAETIASSYPTPLQGLAFASLGKLMRKLRIPPHIPVGTGNIEWWGHWVERWSGRESDLFYVFVKHFHILQAEFLPTEPLSAKERICAPGMLFVHAQILVNLDATIHRNVNNGGPAHLADSTAAATLAAGGLHGSPVLEDVLADPDAIASAMPLPPTNAVRLMAENRLIMLTRDFLSERAADYPAGRQLFAESFNTLLQVCATGTSLFDHAACYTLLDFLEEALVLLARFERSKDCCNGVRFVDLEFWKEVWRKMISSHNTMTEIRLYSFLYTIWNTVIVESGWKGGLCLDILLEADNFDSSFNHWCPMVRAYFMRLLCWRVARHDGDYSSIDVDIFETLMERLGSTWSHYLFLRGLAELEVKAPPSTSPSYPVPSRRLRIVRTDPTVNHGGAFFSFDGLFPTKSPSSSPSPPTKNRSATLSQVEADFRPTSSMSEFDPTDGGGGGEQRGRGIGGFLRNLMPSKTRSKSRNAASRPESHLDSASPPPAMPTGRVRSATDDFQSHRASIIMDAPWKNASVTSITTSSTSDLPATASPALHRKFSFKFSLEYHHNAKPLPPMRLIPPRLPLPAQQFLMTYSANVNTLSAMCAVEPTGESKGNVRYCGRALAEWTLVLGECQSFFDRRKGEGVPCNKLVETPTLGVEVFRRPG